MNNIMIDLETMGNGPDAAIIAIGAVAFDVNLRQIGAQSYCVIDLASAVAGGGVIDPDTVLWWMRQSDAARGAFTRPGKHINHALQEFSLWAATIASPSDLHVWGNGAAFDNVILASAYRRSGIKAPWMFRNDRCYRTMKAMHPDVPIQRSGTHHNAVCDAVSQALHIIEMMSPKPTDHLAGASPAQVHPVVGCEPLTGEKK